VGRSRPWQTAGAVSLSLAHEQGRMLAWATADKPNLPLFAANDPRVVRWYHEDQVFDVARSEPLNTDGASEISLDVRASWTMCSTETNAWWRW
jgi:hypothetical protein